jgi:hypothetical protein
VEIAIEQQIAELGRMTVTQLRQKYAEVFGEESRSNNKQFLYRRIPSMLPSGSSRAHTSNHHMVARGI